MVKKLQATGGKQPVGWGEQFSANPNKVARMQRSEILGFIGDIICPDRFHFAAPRLGNRSLRCSTSCIHAVVRVRIFSYG
jgi:hypothetical protein